MRQQLDTDQKALNINLNEKIYGTFAEIGAGQEVARYFFKVGAAAGTVAKTMSAYDKIVSDDIYGREKKGRYVCESRLYKMLDHEFELIDQRLSQHRPDTNLFVFADTVSTINYHRTTNGHGWLGIRFQLHPQSPPNDIVLHVKMLDHDYQQQQSAVGILGVNLIYACYYYYDDPRVFLQSLMDDLAGRVQVDLVRMTGPDFDHIDNRLLSLWLIQYGLTDVSIIGPDKKNIHASEFLYKKHALIVRGSYRPATLVNWDMIRKSFDQFQKEPSVDPEKAFLLTEITLDNLQSDGEINEKDFLDRTEILCETGHTVLISNCEKYQKLIHYLKDYKLKNLGLVIGVRQLHELIQTLYERNVEGSLLAAFGDIFLKNIRLYVYPAMNEEKGGLWTAHNMPIPPDVRYLYKHLLENRQITDVEHCAADNLSIYSKNVLKMIRAGAPGWAAMVPPEVEKIIREKKLFGYLAQPN
ncbi:MAG: TonB-dependent receptor [Bacteroidetes bacterium]|nr:MAG: TonB-dependent receptor [Bacteroidota bacterium]